jgi:eukaryotic-like serine/threonine-protein kinase
VHRDLKPSNVLLADDGPRVIDFGISRAAEGTSMLTHTGLMLGSPGFMSPEQAEGHHVGPPSDVFSLGALLVFAATGRGPFGTGSTAALVYRVLHAAPDLTAVAAEVRSLAVRCLAKDPGQRPTAAALLTELSDTDVAAGWLPAKIIAASGVQAPGSTPVATPAGGAGFAGATPTQTNIAASTDPHSKGLFDASFSPAGSELAVADGNGHVYVWSIHS